MVKLQKPYIIRKQRQKLAMFFALLLSASASLKHRIFVQCRSRMPQQKEDKEMLFPLPKKYEWGGWGGGWWRGESLNSEQRPKKKQFLCYRGFPMRGIHEKYSENAPQ